MMLDGTFGLGSSALRVCGDLLASHVAGTSPNSLVVNECLCDAGQMRPISSTKAARTRADAENGMPSTISREGKVMIANAMVALRRLAKAPLTGATSVLHILCRSIFVQLLTPWPVASCRTSLADAAASSGKRQVPGCFRFSRTHFVREPCAAKLCPIPNPATDVPGV